MSPLLHDCYQSSQTLPQVYQHYGPSPIQPLSTQMKVLLTVYYLVQLGEMGWREGGRGEMGWREGGR